MAEGIKRAIANAKAMRMTPGMGTWLEEYKCGCSNVTKFKNEALKYCPRHGADKIRIYKLHEAVKVGLS